MRASAWERKATVAMFGNREEKAAQAAAAQAEADRLLALPVADLAAEIMPVFGPSGASTKGGQRIGSLQAANWIMHSYPGRGKHLKELLDPVREGLQALEHAELVQRISLGQGSSHVVATRLGKTALEEGTVREYLNRSGPR